MYTPEIHPKPIPIDDPTDAFFVRQWQMKWLSKYENQNATPGEIAEATRVALEKGEIEMKGSH